MSYAQQVQRESLVYCRCQQLGRSKIIRTTT
jgi:hypothetical protein